MFRIAVSALVVAGWVVGCNVPVSGVFGPDSTALLPGFYEGEGTCETTSTLNGMELSSEIMTSSRSLIISESGFPVVDGLESRVGQVFESSIGTLSLDSTVTSVTNSGSTTVFTGNITIDAVGIGTFTGEFRNIYSQTADGGISVTDSIVAGSVIDDLGNFFLSLNCESVQAPR